MMKVLNCIYVQHDLRLVALAAVICLLASLTAASLLRRARDYQTGTNNILLVATAVVTGFGIWTTHFVAMLAYRQNLASSYDIPLTIASIMIAIVLSGVSYYIATRQNIALSLVGGGLLGVAIALMHFTGMAAWRVNADIIWNHNLVTIGVLTGIFFGSLSLWIIMMNRHPIGLLGGSLLLTAAICGLHFTGMTAVTLSYNPTINLSNALPFQWIAIIVSCIAISIVAIAMTGSLADQFRSNKEAEKLRAHILELTRTKRELEATSASLTDALREAANASQAKSQFLTTMSHELRTPLNAIIGFSQILSSELFGPLNNSRYLEYANDIKDSGAHLLSLINDILDLSRVDAGLLHLREEPADLADLVRESLRMVEPQAAAEKIQLHNEIQDQHLPAHVDAQRVRQIFLNLLSNAIKFTPAGGHVHVTADTSDDQLLIKVKDTGIGISPEDIPRALERFGQVDSKLTRKYEGCGLGLPLSKALMELHGGSLAIESVVNEGTTIVLSFPAERAFEQKAA